MRSLIERFCAETCVKYCVARRDGGRDTTLLIVTGYPKHTTGAGGELGVLGVGGGGADIGRLAAAWAGCSPDWRRLLSGAGSLNRTCVSVRSGAITNLPWAWR
jgi:hypothetical protein